MRKDTVTDFRGNTYTCNRWPGMWVQKPNIRGIFPAVPGEIVFELGVGRVGGGACYTWRGCTPLSRASGRPDLFWRSDSSQSPSALQMQLWACASQKWKPCNTLRPSFLGSENPRSTETKKCVLCTFCTLGLTAGSQALLSRLWNQPSMEEVAVKCPLCVRGRSGTGCKCQLCLKYSLWHWTSFLSLASLSPHPQNGNNDTYVSEWWWLCVCACIGVYDPGSSPLVLVARGSVFWFSS